jgi:hypothetical protein
VLIAGVLVVCSPVFSRADTGKPEKSDSAERVELPVGSHWMGLAAGAVPAESALAWQLQALFDFQLHLW